MHSSIYIFTFLFIDLWAYESLFQTVIPQNNHIKTENGKTAIYSPLPFAKNPAKWYVQAGHFLGVESNEQFPKLFDALTCNYEMYSQYPFPVNILWGVCETKNRKNGCSVVV